MTGADLLRLGRVARMTVETDCDRRFQKADLADAYVTCAADLLDKGEYTHALQLCRRAGEACPNYSEIHSNLGGES